LPGGSRGLGDVYKRQQQSILAKQMTLLLFPILMLV
jgi:hypothetical protein